MNALKNTGNLVQKLSLLSVLGLLFSVVVLLVSFFKPNEQNLFSFLSSYIFESGYLGMAGWFSLLAVVVLSIVIFLSRNVKERLNKGKIVFLALLLQFVFFCYANPISSIIHTPFLADNPFKIKATVYFNSLSLLLIEFFVILFSFILVSLSNVTLVSLKNDSGYKITILFAFFLCFFSIILYQMHYLLS